MIFAVKLTEEKPENKSVNWGAIVLALVAISAGRLIWAAVRGDFEREKPEGFYSAEKLGIALNSKPIAIDVFNDGRIVIDGELKSLEELQALIPEWKASRKLISFYREPKTEDAPSEADAAGSAVFDARLPFSPRTEPQPSEKISSGNGE